jgi:dihydrofolate reductase
MCIPKRPCQELSARHCFGLPGDPADLEQKLDLYRSAHAHVMGRVTYEGHVRGHGGGHRPPGGILNAAPKVVFSRTLTTAGWANTTIAAGDTAEEVDKLRQGGDANIVVGAVSASGGRSCGST